MDNPFADLIPKKAAANPFADLIPKATPLHDMQRNPAAQPTVPNDPIVALGDRARAPSAPPAAPAPAASGGIYEGAKKIGSAAVEGFTGALAPSDEERERGQKAYGRLGEAVATGLTETAKLPAAAANAGTSALSQLLVQLGLGKQGATEEEQRGELNEQLGIGLMGAGVEMPMRAGEAPRAAEAPKPRVEPPPLGTSPAAPAPSPAAPAPSPFENLIPRNAEGRPVVPPGGLPPEAAIKPDPRAAAAGEAAVAKVADRAANPAPEPPKPPAPMPPKPQGYLTPWGALDGSEQSALKSEWRKGVEGGSIGTQFAEWLVAKKGIGSSKASSDPLLAAVQAPFTKSGINTQAFTAGGAAKPTIPSKAPAAPKPLAGAAITHPKPGENGTKVTIHNPHTAPMNTAGYVAVKTNGDVYTVTPGAVVPSKFKPWAPPADWATVSGKNPKADATPFVPEPGLPSGAGALIRDPLTGGYWVVSPTNKFGGFENTLAKGKVDKGSGHDLQTTAIKEIWEETGLKVDIVAHVGDLKSPYSKTRYYLAEAKEGSPAEMGWESQAVHLVPKDKLVDFLKNPDEKKMVQDFLAKPAAAAPAAKTAPAPTKPKAAKPTPQTWHDFVADPKALPLPKGKTTKPDSPFDKWYKEIYQTGKHGEGLPMSDLARKSRAKKQGFNTDLTLYHGTGKSDFLRFDMAKHQSENAIFLSDDPRVSKAYSSKGSTPAVIPLWAKMENPKTIDWKGQHYGSTSDKFRKAIDQAKAEGHDVVIIKNMYDSGSSAPQTQYAFFKPGNIRSQKSAAFDPKVKEPDAHLLSAASTPTHELLKQNTADYEDKLPKAPGAVQLVKDAGNTLKAILHPQSLNGSARRAEGSIRKNIGRGVQDSERAKVAMEPYRKLLQKMSTEQQLGVLKWLQKPEEAAQRHVKAGSGTFDPPDELKPFLSAFRDLMLDRKDKLEARSKTGDMGFKDDYVSQMWRDPDAARDVLHSLGPKEGSNSFTKRSVIDDYEAGIKAGLIPLTTDPVEIAMRYVENVDRFIAINDVLEEGAANKDIVWRAPEHAPNGWVKLDGRARSFKGGAFQDAYAPPGYADVYNAFVSKPPQGRWGDILSGAQKISNSVSAFKLAVSGYHALNIAGEANVAGLANAIDKLAGGDVLGATRGVVGSPAKFVTSVARGRQMLNTYLTGMGSKDMQKVVQLAVDANFRVAGKGRVADEYRFSSMGSLWDSWRKGLLKGELAAMGKDIKERPLVGSAKAIVSTAARALETLSDPLFKHYIPMVKNGAYFDMVKTWLDAHPTATNEEQVAFARKAADIIDNRFGEMNQDNIFWQRWQKQLAQTLVVSYSYELGTARSVVGAAKDAVGLARGKGWTPNLSYAIALPAMVGMMGATYQYMKTGKPPDGPRDAMYPQTGGTDPMSGQPARAVLPSYMSQFVNAYFGGLTHELAGKKNGVFDLLNAAFTGTDWRGDPITAVDDSTTDAIKKWLGYAAGTWEPILATQTKKGGTGISGGERFAGIREAPMFANDPQAYKRMMDSKRLQGDADKAWHDRNADLEAKGQHPNFMVKRKFIQDYLAHHKPKYGGTQ